MILLGALAASAGAQNATVGGIVRDNTRNPIPGATVNLLESNTGATMGPATSGADGRFSIPGVPPGQYMIVVSFHGQEAARTPDFPVPAGGNLSKSVILSADQLGKTGGTTPGQTANTSANADAAIKAINDAVKAGKAEDAKDQYCSNATDPRLQRRCKALDSDIADFTTAERSQMTGQGVSSFNAGNYSQARNVFRNVRSRSLQAERQRWLDRVDRMEAGKNAAQAGRLEEAIANLRPIATSTDAESAGARLTANQLLDQLYQQRISAAQSKVGSSNKSDLDSARGALDEAARIKPGDSTVASLQAKLAAQYKSVGGTVTVAELEDAINAYYRRSYSEAESKLSSFIDRGGTTPRQLALAHFYRGACKFSRQQLTGGPEDSMARDDFRQARGTRGFSPPDSQYVSPKILKAYQQS